MFETTINFNDLSDEKLLEVIRVAQEVIASRRPKIIMPDPPEKKPEETIEYGDGDCSWCQGVMEKNASDDICWQCKMDIY